MKLFFTIIKSDYLQRTRSYAFLVTLCLSFAVAYTFVPAPSANYTTINIGGFQGEYNAAWFGYVTAIMTSIFLSLVGFFLVTGSIKTDKETKVGQIIASTLVSNFKYLLSKVISNFLVLATIVLLIFIMSIILFFMYNDQYPFELIHFIKPYFFITLPALFVVAVLAVIFEVFFGKYTVLQNLGFFFLFSTLMVIPAKNNKQFSLDFIGSKIVTHQMEVQVKEILQVDTLKDLGIGYILKSTETIKKFTFNGIDFSTSFLLSRFFWIFFSIGIIGIVSLFFHRFNVKETHKRSKNKTVIKIKKTHNEINLSLLPTVVINYSILPLIKTELLLLFRKGKNWMWLFTAIGMVLLATLPLDIACKMVLPVVWFLQVNRLSNISSKETTNNVHCFVFSSYHPLSRLLVSQLLAGIILILTIALPLIIRIGFTTSFLNAILVVLGGVFIVLLASLLGMLAKGKKLFEVIFFLITYANMNGIPFFDYFGNYPNNTLSVLILSIIFLLATFGLRRYQLKNN